MAYAQEELLWNAIAEALAPVAHLEVDLEGHKLVKRIRDYFRKAARTLEFGSRSRSWDLLVGDYAESVFGALFQGLGDRKWLSQADFLLAMDAGVKETFPPAVIANVPQEEFERTVLVAHDRAFEEQRFLPALWSLVQELVSAEAGPKAKKKVLDAAEVGRKEAMRHAGRATDAQHVKAFVSKWIDSTVANLSRTTQGDPTSALSQQQAIRLFHSLLQAEALPIPMTAQFGQPPRGWPFVDYAVHMAYRAHSGEDLALEPRRGKGKGLNRSTVKGKARGRGKPSVEAAEVGAGANATAGWSVEEAGAAGLQHDVKLEKEEPEDDEIGEEDDDPAAPSGPFGLALGAAPLGAAGFGLDAPSGAAAWVDEGGGRAAGGGAGSPWAWAQARQDGAGAPPWASVDGDGNFVASAAYARAPPAAAAAWDVDAAQPGPGFGPVEVPPPAWKRARPSPP